MRYNRSYSDRDVQKTFTDYDDCAKAWASRQWASGGMRRVMIGGMHGGALYRGRRLYFEGERIFSYGSHYCAARLSNDRVPGPNGSAPICYVNANAYSVVTDQRHMPAVRGAANRAGFLLLESVYPGNDYPAARVNDCAAFVDKALERYAQALTARLPTLWQHIDAADKFKATAVLHFRLIARGDTARRVTTKSTMRKLARARRLAVERMGRLMERKFLPVATARAYAEDSHITATAVSYRSGVPRMVAELANGARVIVSIADHGAVSSTLESAS
jgi:hypothetical protein